MFVWISFDKIQTELPNSKFTFCPISVFSLHGKDPRVFNGFGMESSWNTIQEDSEWLLCNEPYRCSKLTRSVLDPSRKS